jgi:hypothetical protein
MSVSVGMWILLGFVGLLDIYGIISTTLYLTLFLKAKIKDHMRHFYTSYTVYAVLATAVYAPWMMFVFIRYPDHITRPRTICNVTIVLTCFIIILMLTQCMCVVLAKFLFFLNPLRSHDILTGRIGRACLMASWICSCVVLVAGCLITTTDSDTEVDTNNNETQHSFCSQEHFDRRSALGVYTTIICCVAIAVDIAVACGMSITLTKIWREAKRIHATSVTNLGQIEGRTDTTKVPKTSKSNSKAVIQILVLTACSVVFHGSLLTTFTLNVSGILCFSSQVLVIIVPVIVLSAVLLPTFFVCVPQEYRHEFVRFYKRW